jgi:nucleoside-diphosphate-sugar epimerase
MWRLCKQSPLLFKMTNMKFYITGEKGLIAQNLKIVLEASGHTVVSDEKLFLDRNYEKLKKTGEACIHRNHEDFWAAVFKSNGIDIVVHNAAVVGTDVVALNPSEATLTNIQGTYNIVRAAKQSNSAVCYLGTTVIYDTKWYQQMEIVEDSKKSPQTYYGVQKLAAEQIVSSMADRWSIVRPLFAFGGLGDMNSLIAKSIYAHLNDKKSIDMFLDPAKVKDYLYVSDFCKAVEMVCNQIDGVGGGTDWNVSAETPIPAGEVMSIVDQVLGSHASSRVKWHPRTDYLGNHRLSSRKIREKLGWKPQLDLQQGIRETLEWIRSAEDYNPLAHLDEALEKKVDLLGHFPR